MLQHLGAKKIKLAISAYFLLSLFLVYNQPVALAQTAAATGPGPVEQSIRDLLCTPTEPVANQPSAAAGDLSKCINKLYKLAIAISAVVAVFFLVVAGYLYMASDGSQESVTKAKEILISTLTGLVILMISFLLLKQINPDLVKFASIQSTAVTDPCQGKSVADCIGHPVDGGGGGVPSGNTQQLASQILNNSKITLATAHASGVSDNATAKQNITDTSNGQQAKTSTYGDAKGASVSLSPAMLQGLLTVAGKFNSIAVSEIAGGDHRSGSNHYTGQAFDINYANGEHLTGGARNAPAVIAACKAAGATEVTDETASNNHVHCGAWSGASSGGNGDNPPGGDSADQIPPPGTKAWSGQDPYQLDWGPKSQQLQAALNIFKTKYSSALRANQAYRPPEYTNHIRSVYEAFALLNNLDPDSGYNCGSRSRLVTKTQTDAYSANQKKWVSDEASKHGVRQGGTPPACQSDHEKGISMDIYPVPTDFSGSKVEYHKYLQAGYDSGLCHNIAGDEPHFALRSELGLSGQACLQD